ncbi:ABC transporter ATP-binding protein [Oxobacter pfennigii]|nr:ABC transporter ATP-binding protein [Oxobacter pfennigii]
MAAKLRLMWAIMRGNRLQYFGAILSMGISAVLSLATPLIVKVAIDYIIQNKPEEVPEFLMWFINKLGGREVLMNNLWVPALILVAVTALNGIFLYLKGKLSAEASEAAARNMRDVVYSHIQSLPYDYHVKAETGDLIQRCTSDIETIRRFLAVQMVEMGNIIFMIASALTVMISLNINMTLVSTATMPFIFIFAVVFFNKVSRLFQDADEAEGRLSTTLQENLTAVRVVKAFGRQKYEVDKYDEKNREYRDKSFKLSMLLAVYLAMSDFVIMSQTGIVLIYGVYRTVTGAITLGTLVVFTSYEGKLLWPIRHLGRILTDAGKALVSLGRIKEILDAPLEDMKENGLKPQMEGDIEFENVSLGYEEGREILEDISFTAKKGETIAILGATGSGKSSLVHLLQGLYDYNSGHIYIDGVELKDINKEHLRKNVGLILQEPFLFSRSIKENIGLSNYRAGDDEVFEAARVSSVHDVINEFEEGYDTIVGERGVTLSGGQKQRVAMARTLVMNTPILIFDDSLSAVDTETDVRIRNSLKERKNTATTFIISHRITTLKEADLILVLHEGKLKQTGTHEQLVSEEGLYQRIWNIQNSIEQEIVKAGDEYGYV